MCETPSSLCLSPLPSILGFLPIFQFFLHITLVFRAYIHFSVFCPLFPISPLFHLSFLSFLFAKCNLLLPILKSPFLSTRPSFCTLTSSHCMRPHRVSSHFSPFSPIPLVADRSRRSGTPTLMKIKQPSMCACGHV